MNKNGVFFLVAFIVLAGLGAWMFLADSDDGESARQAAKPARAASGDFHASGGGNGVADSRTAEDSADGLATEEGGEAMAADDDRRASVAPVESGVAPTGSKSPTTPQPDRAASPGAEASPSEAEASDKSDADGPGLDMEAIQEAMNSYKPVVKRCYERLLQDFPDVSGKVTIAFDIITEEGEGRIELAELADSDDVGVKTDLFDTRLHDCMLSNLGELTFPAPRGGQKLRVNYPFRLRAEAKSDKP
jgi:hypothetical protein